MAEAYRVMLPAGLCYATKSLVRSCRALTLSARELLSTERSSQRKHTGARTGGKVHCLEPYVMHEYRLRV